MHGLPQSDFPFTAVFQQEGEKVDGVLAFFFAGTAVISSSLKDNKLELRMNTPLANFMLTGEYKPGEVSGQWSTDEGSRGTWGSKKIVETAVTQ